MFKMTSHIPNRSRWLFMFGVQCRKLLVFKVKINSVPLYSRPWEYFFSLKRSISRLFLVYPKRSISPSFHPHTPFCVFSWTSSAFLVVWVFVHFVHESLWGVPDSPLPSSVKFRKIHILGPFSNSLSVSLQYNLKYPFKKTSGKSFLILSRISDAPRSIGSYFGVPGVYPSYYTVRPRTVLCLP